MNYPRQLLNAAFFLIAASATAQQGTSLQAGFLHPPASAMPLTWWHWINGNVSREGILADMQDMKRVGLGGAQMIDVSMYIPQGSARYGSEEWYGDIQYAIQTAHQLGLSFGMMNGPGWSGSGGPWVTPDMAMQHVVWSEATVDGGHTVHLRLERPSATLGFYRDIAVLAVPADHASDDAAPVLEAVPANLFAPASDKTLLSAGTDATVTFRYPQALERRSLELRCQQPDASGMFSGEIEISKDGKSFQTVRQFALQGALGGSSLLIAFPASTAKEFRIHLHSDGSAMPALASMHLGDEDRIENYRSKTLSAVVQPVLDSSTSNVLDPDAVPLSRVIPLTAFMAEDGSLSWDAPAGRWTILRFGYTPTGSQNHPAQAQGTGLEIDKMNVAATDTYFEHSLGRILRDAGPLVGTTFNSIVIDSWESGQQNWTADVPTAFLKARGYALEEYLPTLTGRVIVSPSASEAFLRDFRRTLSELVADRYYGEFRRLAESHHLSLYAETYDGINFNQAESAARSSVQTAEFWAPHMLIDDERMKSIASEAHVLGNHVVAAEAFTGQPAEAMWMWSPQSLKPIGDGAFAHGINRFLLHSYVHQPSSDIMPGFTLSRFGTHFGRLNTWWPESKPWLDYVARSSFLLQQGSPVSDILALHSDEIDGLQPEAPPDLPEGYSYDWILPESLLTATVGQEGIELPQGGTYHALVLPSVWTSSLRVLQEIQKIVDTGVPVFGPRPVAPSSMRDMEQMQAWQKIVDSLWPINTSVRSDVPAKTILPLLVATKVIASQITPDVLFASREAPASITSIQWAHRRTDSSDIYFLANTGETNLRFTAAFRSGDRTPELWDAITGKHTDAPLFTRTKYGVSLPFEMEPGRSIFVVFTKPLEKTWIDAVTNSNAPLMLRSGLQPLRFMQSGQYSIHFSDGTIWSLHLDLPEPLDLNQNWMVNFQPPIGPAFNRHFTLLHDLAEDNDTAVRYFSGRARYRRTVYLTAKQLEGNRCLLTLGDVQNIATVRINGHDVGSLWTAPFEVDVKAWLHEGDNTVEVIVTDRWVNRLVGDEHLPPDAHYLMDGGPIYSGRLAEFPDWYSDPAKTALRKRTTFATWQLFSQSSSLVPAGLIGPVKLVFYRDLPPKN